MPKTAKNRLTNAEIAERVADRIIEQLEQGTIPWHKPWSAQGLVPMNVRHANSKTPRPYRGINILLLAMQGYGSPYWMTYNQANQYAYRAWCKTNGHKVEVDAKGKPNQSSTSYRAFQKDENRGGVRKGEKSTQIIFWKVLKFEDKVTGEDKVIPLARFFNVFNVEQCTDLGLNLPQADDEAKIFDPCEEAEAIIDGWTDEPPVTHGGDSAYYSPMQDRIQLPEREAFDTPTDYYFTRFHEGVHATGHADRLNRPEIATATVIFGSEDYSKEELVAEMGAAILGAHAGLDGAKRIENTAAYIKHWLGKLRDDKGMLMKAAALGQKAADSILGVSYSYDEDEAVTDNKAAAAA